jgi:hypothetical protein
MLKLIFPNFLKILLADTHFISFYIRSYKWGKNFVMSIYLFAEV